VSGIYFNFLSIRCCLARHGLLIFDVRFAAHLPPELHAMHRRAFLKSTIALIGGTPFAGNWFTGQPGHAHDNERFDYARVKGHAQALAQRSYQPPNRDLPGPLARLDYDGHQALRFRASDSLWRSAPNHFRVQFFHRSSLFKERVRLHEIVNGRAREIGYHPSLFDFRKSGIEPRSLSKDLGFAGFRLHFHTDWEADIASFLGASYFRAVGTDTRQYGLSARGLAIDTGLDGGEEFPIFTHFWLERPAENSARITVYGLLDSVSATGAYRFEIAPGSTTVMDVDAALYPRKTIERLGIAPLTSMYQHGENDRRMAHDWRPEIHDSDGLALFTGGGEWIWRPLVNQPAVRVNSYFDHDPRGFGLLQRDRSFDHYQDDGAHYDRRPSLWVEPKIDATGGWGKGAVQLVELPAPDETYDNIVAFWNPAEKPQPGQELLFSYRLHWGTRVPFAPRLAQTLATRTGVGGRVGQKRNYFSWRFAVDFAGGELASLPQDAEVEPVITASRGEIEIASARPQKDVKGYRAMFDLRPTDSSIEPIDLRLYLRLNGQPLTETWLYQWNPPPPAERKY
jgi:periplasmic glucans biosynthesis protein